jgi:hypothetical protein
MTAIELLNELEEYTKSNVVHMYLVERKIKPNAKAKDKPSERFEYIPLQINLNEALVPIVKGMLQEVIKRKIKENVEIKPYEVIDDTEDKLQIYSDFGKISGFQEFLNTRLGGEIKPLDSFEEIYQLEKAWAICYGFYHNEKKKWLYCIKKIAPRNMVVDIETSTSVIDAMKNGFTSLFDISTKTLKPFTGFSLNIEPSIDLIYFDEHIYIFRKKAFEDITSLTEEFEIFANVLVAEVEQIDFIDGMQYLSTIINSKPAFRNKLIKAKNIGNIDFLKTCKDIKKEFQRAGKKLEIKFNFDLSGKIIASNEEEAESIIKVLSEYYKEGIFARKIFESPAGRLKNNSSK